MLTGKKESKKEVGGTVFRTISKAGVVCMLMTELGSLFML